MRCLIALTFLVLLVGCGTTSNIVPGSNIFSDQSSSFLLLRVDPQYRIHLLRGKVDGQYWVRPRLDIPEINIIPGPDGYIFVKLKTNASDERLGVSLIFPDGKPYAPCGGSVGATFDLRPSAITYVGELLYEFDGKRLYYRHQMDELDARNYLERNFGSRHSLVEVVPMVPMIVKYFCQPWEATLVPIYLPR